jgi:hypothetical protein
VIAMRMGDKDRVQWSKVLDRWSRDSAPHVQDAPAEQRVGHQSPAGQLGQHRRVTNVGEPARLRHRYGAAVVVVVVVVAVWGWSWWRQLTRS